MFLMSEVPLYAEAWDLCWVKFDPIATGGISLYDSVRLQRNGVVQRAYGSVSSTRLPASPNLSRVTWTMRVVHMTYMGTSLTRKCTPLGPYRRPMPRVLGGT